MHKHKVSILINTLKTGGAEKQSIYLLHSLKEFFIVEFIVYYGNQKDERMIQLLGAEIQNVIWLRGSHFSRIISLYKIFRDYKPEICISYLATTNLLNAILGRFTGVKIRIGGIRNSKLHWFKEVVQRHLHNHWLTHSVFNNYNGYSSLINRGFNEVKGTVIFNCIEKIPESIPVRKNDRITILSVGRFVGQKDYYTAFQVIKILLKRCPDFNYTIVGQGELENELRVFIREAELYHNVKFIINPSDVDIYYRTSDIFLSTSLFEGLSNSIMEAMSFGLPVVATNVGDNKYLIKDGETGFLANVKDSELIASKLEILINDAQLRNTMGARGRQHIIENFSIEKFTQQYIDLIEKLSNEA